MKNFLDENEFEEAELLAKRHHTSGLRLIARSRAYAVAVYGLLCVSVAACVIVTLFAPGQFMAAQCPFWMIVASATAPTMVGLLLGVVAANVHRDLHEVFPSDDVLHAAIEHQRRDHAVAALKESTDATQAKNRPQRKPVNRGSLRVVK